MRQRSLLDKNLAQFITCTAALLLLATPLFYWLTKLYYAEDLIDVIESIKQGDPIPAIDLEEDIMHGIMIQFGLIAVVLGVAIVITMVFVSKKTWRPFDRTLKLTEDFRLESGVVPKFPESDVKEFNRLNASVGKLISNSLDTYRSQKEFTENASHELQTPLAIFRSKLDILMQQPDLSKEQAEIIQDLYDTINRLTLLNRNLLLLAKIDNQQYSGMIMTDLNAMLDSLVPDLEALSGDIRIRRTSLQGCLNIRANKALLESMVNNLVVNAVRHNRPNGVIEISTDACSLTVANTSDNNQPLDKAHIFNRFYRPMGKERGNGLGLAIVKAICDYHGWAVSYKYENTKHIFSILFNINTNLKQSSK